MLKAKYNRTLNQDSFLAPYQDIIQDLFNLYKSIKTKHNILNIYNINENKYMIGIAGSFKVIFLKYQKQTFINQASNYK